MVNHLPCPFCGSSDLVMQERKRDRAYFVECRHCLARGPVYGLADESWRAWSFRFKLEPSNDPELYKP